MQRKPDNPHSLLFESVLSTYIKEDPKNWHRTVAEDTNVYGHYENDAFGRVDRETVTTNRPL